MTIKEYAFDPRNAVAPNTVQESIYMQKHNTRKVIFRLDWYQIKNGHTIKLVQQQNTHFLNFYKRIIYKMTLDKHALYNLPLGSGGIK